jgi:uracil-DNA glycosylase
MDIKNYLVTVKVDKEGFFAIPSYISDYITRKYRDKKTIKTVFINIETDKIMALEPYEILFDSISQLEGKYNFDNYQLGSYHMMYYKFKETVGFKLSSNDNRNAKELKLIKDRFNYEWYNSLRPVILSDIPNIMKTLASLSAHVKIFPSKENIFKIFKDINPNNVKVVILGGNPYNSEHATGIAFDSKLESKPKSFQLIEKALGLEYPDSSSLDGRMERWVKQGVMLLNSSLTTSEKVSVNHNELWKNFISSVIASLSLKKVEILFLLIGEQAHEFKPLIPSHHKVLIIEDPVKSLKEERDWKNKKCFTKVNTFLSITTGIKISWLKKN